ncbi:MAG: hypothetical protein AUI83_23405 [Armatimonadetes bacterium 13_1_40CM_3_65_7]|nr:MAG: hypothetical protein AUI83_23405 [Armatimonadetes bacterium 13_1_40CM_3_65_7]
MAIREDDAIEKFRQIISRVDPRLVLDRGDVRYVTEPYAGVEYGLRLGKAGALLFMPEADLTAPDWQDRLRTRFEAAKRYLEGFPHRD